MVRIAGTLTLINADGYLVPAKEKPARLLGEIQLKANDDA
jgi:hypothetical protein